MTFAIVVADLVFISSFMKCSSNSLFFSSLRLLRSAQAAAARFIPIPPQNTAPAPVTSRRGTERGVRSHDRKRDGFLRRHGPGAEHAPGEDHFQGRL